MATVFAPAQTLERAIKGKFLAEHAGLVVHMASVRYRVQSSDGRQWYVVDLGAQTCTYPDSRYRGAVCKHLHTARQTAEPARIRVRVDEHGAVVGWHLVNAADAQRQIAAETVQRIADELFPL